MARYYLKPIFWNTQGYRRPSGVRANSGYPAEHGFGHEEWNNADFLKFLDGGRPFRAFHTLDIARAIESDGQVFIFMYASHDGLQQLVGVAGKATCLRSAARRGERDILVNRLGIGPRWTEAWDLPNVQSLHANDKRRFRRFWNDGVHWTPSGKCPEGCFFWPNEPITLNPMLITGSERLPPMFSRHTEIDPVTAKRVMNFVPLAARTPEWFRICDEIDAAFADPAADIQDIMRLNLPETTTQALVDARLGQGDFRAGLMTRWDGACAVTGCRQPQVLRASHMKPWRSSSNSERLHPCNGLLLSANLDALFDQGLVSFEDTGQMMVSGQVGETTRILLGLPSNLRCQLNDEERFFLQFHHGLVPTLRVGMQPWTLRVL